MMYTRESIFEQARAVRPVGLAERIFSAVELEAARRLRRRASIASWSALVSFGVFVASLVVVGDSFLTSDFWQIMSLLFSDLSFVTASSEQFLLSLAETFPAASASVLIAPLFLYAVSLAFRSKYANLAMRYGSFQLKIGY